MPEMPLAAILSQQIARLEHLYRLSLLKKEALLQEEFERINEIVAEENTLLHEYQAADDACLSQVQFFLEASPLELGKEDAAVKGQILQMRELAAKLQVSNEYNIALIKDSLGFIQFSLNLLTAPPVQGSTVYGASGKVVEGKTKHHLLDCKG